jgi:GT2 family glycosyltransferase
VEKQVADLGVVVIGRNEGERLRRCLESVVGAADLLVYVDSGSTDDSVAMAQGMGAQVVELDMCMPFTAARARNAGFRQLLGQSSGLKFVQFVDGDCEMHRGWLAQAVSFLENETNVAMACGRLRERFPEQTIYNQLCDIEWNTPVGEAKACGGIAMARVAALQQACGFTEGLIAGEEPELCIRLRKAGWKIWRIDAEMALHDAAMTRFMQWWKRSVRAGHAFAEGASLHGQPPERHYVREARRAWLWGILLPILILLISVFSSLGTILLLIYPLQVVRLCRSGNLPWRKNCMHALFLVLGKFPEAAGLVKYHFRSFKGAGSRLIEYK